MLALNENESALLELMVLKPLTYLPPLHRSIARKLTQQGLVEHKSKLWYPTAVGLAVAKRTLH